MAATIQIVSRASALLQVRYGVLAALLFILLTPPPYNAGAAQRADDCSWRYVGDRSSRAAVKIRTAGSGANYPLFNHGDPITVDQWFGLACSLDAQVPESIPLDRPMSGIETVRVTLRGYLLAAYFQRNEDHDIHLELSATPEWDSQHVIAEIPGGEEFCKARKKLWKYVRKDIKRAGGSGDEDTWVMHGPIAVLVTGYIFLDSNNADRNPDYCDANGDRGLHKDGQPSRVRGLWELHPVLLVTRPD